MIGMKITKTYSELIQLPTFEERLVYLRLEGEVGKETFGYDRYLNQVLYKSKEWKRVRDEVIIRDSGYDLGCEGYLIVGHLIIHHINPISIEDINERNPDIFNPEYLISTSLDTHNAIHYGNDIFQTQPIIRTVNDTCPWKN